MNGRVMGKCYGTEGPRSTSATFPEVASQLDRVVTFVSQGLDYRNLCIIFSCTRHWGGRSRSIAYNFCYPVKGKI